MTAVVRSCRALLLLGLALACVLPMVPGQRDLPAPALEPAADLTNFKPGNIITDAVFFDSEAMTASQIQTFLNGKVPVCEATTGPTCLKGYRTSTTTIAADAYCPGRYSGATNETAAAIIAKVSRACDINPRVLLVTLQKEMGFITSTAPTSKMYTRAMGYGCPDNAGGTCSAYYPGLFKQLYYAARQFQRYKALTYHIEPGWNTILWHPNSSCGSSRVYIENAATAGLYLYTPYRPNAASLRAGYGLGDSCSSYGNRNFWNYFTDWFGTTYATGRDVEAPMGRLDMASGGRAALTVAGWAFDPSAPTTATSLHVYVDGRFSKAIATGVARPDVQSAYARFGVGPSAGYRATIPAAPGNRAVCVYAINVGPGYSNPNLGCRTVVVTDPANPVGSLDLADPAGSAVSLWGWAFDPDAPTATATVRVTVDGRAAGEVAANAWRPDVGNVYPAAGDRHGYVWSGRLTAGTHRVCTVAVNVGAGSASPQLGCRTVTVSGTAPGASSNPVGRLDTVTTSGSAVSVWGWTFDPDLPPAIVPVTITVDGTKVGEVPALGWRADVGQKYPAAGDRHAYDWSGTLSPGSHQVCAVAANQGAGTANPRLGCQTVTVDGSAPGPESVPDGRLDVAKASGNAVTVWGWALDQDLPFATVPVTVTVDGAAVAEVPAAEWRLDLASAFPGSGVKHGYLWSGTLAAGSHSVCAVAANLGAGSTSPQLGCRTVTVGSSTAGAASAPAGRLDLVRATGTSVSVWGWAYDQDVPRATSSVRVTVDGVAAGTVPAYQWRSDVGRAIPAAGDRHGYAWAGTLKAGTHEVCVFGMNLGAGSTDPRLGCKSVTVGAAAPAEASRPVGRLDAVTASGTTVTAAGWAFDPDLPPATTEIHVYVDGAHAGTTKADASRPDVGAAYPEAGNLHGYSWSGTVAEGEHRVCAYAINLAAGAGNPRLGCRAVTVS